MLYNKTGLFVSMLHLPLRQASLRLHLVKPASTGGETNRSKVSTLVITPFTSVFQECCHTLAKNLTLGLIREF